MTAKTQRSRSLDDATLRARLYAISRGEPDTKLSANLSRSVPELARRGWLQICGHSDGDYVKITEKGQWILDGEP